MTVPADDVMNQSSDSRAPLIGQPNEIGIARGDYG
jgi:hypothetical protein